MSDSETNKIRQVRMLMKNKAIEGDHRPSSRLLMIREATLAYYQCLDPLLDRALSLAEQAEGPVVVEIAREKLEEVVASGVDAALRNLMKGEASLEAAKEPTPANEASEDAEWLPMAELFEKFGVPKSLDGTARNASYSGKIRSSGEGRGKLFHSKDFEQWHKSYRPRG